MSNHQNGYQIEKLIQNARPNLRLVAPLTSAICWGFSIVNIILGLSMLFIYRGTVAPIAVANILSYPQWGALFLITGLIMAYSLTKNNWRLAKQAQLAGLLIKTIWLIALIVRCFDNPQTILITAVWGFFSYIQAVTYIHFMPQMTTWKIEDKAQENA